MYLGALAALLLVASCQPEEVTPVADVEPEFEEFLIVTSAEEVDALLVKEYGDSDRSIEEKLSFLSDYYALQATEEYQASARGASTDSYVAVAQVFDGVNFFTDVATGDGTADIIASEFELRHGFIAFAGCNANVYKNGNNIGGRITNVQDFSCSDDVFLSAIARWREAPHPNGTVSNSVRIFCDRIPDRPDIRVP